MQDAVMRTSASVGDLMVESGTSATRTSPAPYISVARMVSFLLWWAVAWRWVDARWVAIGRSSASGLRSSSRPAGEDVFDDWQRGEHARPAGVEGQLGQC